MQHDYPAVAEDREIVFGQGFGYRAVKDPRIDFELVGHAQGHAVFPREPQQVELAVGKVVEQVLQPPAPSPSDKETRPARSVGSRIAHRMDGQLGQSGELLAAMAEDIGATDQQPVVIHRRGRFPCDRLDGEQRAAMHVEPHCLRGFRADRPARFGAEEE